MIVFLMVVIAIAIIGSSMALSLSSGADRADYIHNPFSYRR